MTKIKKTLAHTARAGLLALMAVLLPITVQAAHHEKDDTIRAMAMSMEAEVVAIDLETREVSLKGPTGKVVTLTSPEKAVKLEDMQVGDKVVATYFAAMEAELRAPTEEELAEPWLVVEEAGVLTEGEAPGIGEAQIIRAVCTIEGLNRQLGAVTIKDSRGKLHVIGDVEPEKMEGVTLGQTIVVVYAQAMALTLEKKEAAAQ